MTTTQTDAIMALADRYAFHIPGSQHSDEARAALLAALQAREGFEEGTNCEHGCIDAVIVRADAIAAPQPAQPEQRTGGCTLCGHCASTGEKIQSAQPVAQPLPLTDEQIKTMWAQYAGYIGGVLDFARAIEAAHGIGGAL